MNLSIETSIALLSAFNQRLEHGAPHLYAAINNGIAALETIQDGNYHLKTHLNSVYEKMCYHDTDTAGKIDLKTLYEQTTMYCDFIEKSYHTSTAINPNNHEKIIRNYALEVWQQPDTPIYILVYWNTEETHIEEITYKIIKGEKP